MNAVFLPILLPMATAAFALLALHSPRAQRGFILFSGVIQVALAVWLLVRVRAEGILAASAGNWTPPFGIVIAIDPLSAIMLCLGAVTTLAAMVFGMFEMEARLQHPLRLPLVQFLACGINLSFCTGDLFNLFVAFEIMLVASYALLTLEADDWDVKQAYPYLAMNMVGSTLFLCAAGLAYSVFGTLNFGDMAVRAREMAGDPRILLLALLLGVVFATKAGLFPLYFWLPNSYPTLSVPVAALYSGMLTKVGIYAIFRMLGTVFPHDLVLVHPLLAWMAALTMLFGVIGAISRNFIRGILSFHILSQVGFILLAVGFFTPLSLMAAIFYIIHHIIVKASLFLVGGVAALLNRTDDLDKMGNLWKHVPFLGVLFLVQALSLAGLPPLSGFWGKYLILIEGIRLGKFALVGASLLASVLTLFSMLKIWHGAFWAHNGDRGLLLGDPRRPGLVTVIACMAALSLLIGFGAEFFLTLSREAADSLLDWRGYADAVFAIHGKDGL